MRFLSYGTGDHRTNPSYPSNPSNPWLKNKERKDALYAGCPCRAPFVWDIYTQGVASLCPGLSACYPFRELTLQDYPAGQGFIFVYRLAIDVRTLRGDDES